jgi:hypothetical protein
MPAIAAARLGKGAGVPVLSAGVPVLRFRDGRDQGHNHSSARPSAIYLHLKVR